VDFELLPKELLEGAYTKLGRGRTYAKAVDREINTYIESNPYEIVPKFYEETGSHRLQLKLVRRPPVEIGLLVGDAIHSLRCALDHLAWQLANLDGPPADRYYVQFPIYDKPKGFADSRQMSGMRAEHRAVLESLQPYEGSNPPEQHILSILAKLSNADKHRVILPTTIATLDLKSEKLEARPGYRIARYETFFEPGASLKDGTEFGEVLILPRNPEAQMDMNATAATVVLLDEKGEGLIPLPPKMLLDRIANAIGQVLDYFNATIPDSEIEGLSEGVEAS
jgi:hypothetical protein